MSNEKDTAREFQLRRRKTFRIVLPLGLATVISMAILLLIGITGIDAPALTIPFLALMIFLFLGIIILTVNAHYRCPRCKEIPWTDSFTEQGGIDLNPEICSKCGARLK